MNKTHLSLILAAALLGLAPAAQAFMCMPVYGNWCGPGHPRAGDNPPPVDEFDAACMRHDYCTASPVNSDVCDVNFVQELRFLAGKYQYLPKPLQWAEYLFRVKSGGNPMNGMPMPTPWDAFGAMTSVQPCW
jgi:hypothetical protein